MRHQRLLAVLRSGSLRRVTKQPYPPLAVLITSRARFPLINPRRDLKLSVMPSGERSRSNTLRLSLRRLAVNRQLRAPLLTLADLPELRGHVGMQIRQLLQVRPRTCLRLRTWRPSLPRGVTILRPPRSIKGHPIFLGPCQTQLEPLLDIMLPPRRTLVQLPVVR